VTEGINDRIEPQRSWAWKWSVTNGGCYGRTGTRFDIKNGAEIELNSAEKLAADRKINSATAEIDFHRAEFIRATIFFRDEMQKKDFPGHDSYMKIGPRVKYSKYRNE